MKKINLVVALSILVAGVSACEGDDDVTFVQQDYLAGKWNVTEVGSLNSQNNIEYQNYDNCDQDHYTFTEENLYQESLFTLEENGTCTNNTVEASFQRQGSNIVISHPNDDGVMVNHIKKVISLDYTEMEITYTDSLTDQLVFKKLVRE